MGLIRKNRRAIVSLKRKFAELDEDAEAVATEVNLLRARDHVEKVEVNYVKSELQRLNANIVGLDREIAIVREETKRAPLGRKDQQPSRPARQPQAQRNSYAPKRQMEKPYPFQENKNTKSNYSPRRTRTLNSSQPAQSKFTRAEKGKAKLNEASSSQHQHFLKKNSHARIPPPAHYASPRSEYNSSIERKVGNYSREEVRGSGGRNKPHHSTDAGSVVKIITLLKCAGLKMVIMTAIYGRIR